MSRLTDPWTLGGIEIRNRLVLAPLAGIGNWFVRLQAKRFGAGLVFSEMVSSFGLAHGNARTVREFLRIHPDEHPVAMQLFGHDPAVMREAAAMAAEAGADLIDLNMGCPVRKVCRTGAGAALLADPDRAVAIARAAREGGGLPVTVKLRPGHQPGERDGVDAGAAPGRRGRRRGHRLPPSARLAAALGRARLRARRASSSSRCACRCWCPADCPRTSARCDGFEESGAEAVMLARGSLGNPWRFGGCSGLYEGEPTPAEVAGRAPLGDRVRRGASRRRARGSLPAEVLPLVRRAARRSRSARRSPSWRHRRPRTRARRWPRSADGEPALAA